MIILMAFIQSISVQNANIPYLVGNSQVLNVRDVLEIKKIFEYQMETQILNWEKLNFRDKF